MCAGGGDQCLLRASIIKWPVGVQPEVIASVSFGVGVGEVACIDVTVELDLDCMRGEYSESPVGFGAEVFDDEVEVVVVGRGWVVRP